METSEWACMSMKPGHTTWPVASIVSLRSAAAKSPTASIRPSAIATSARYAAAPVPSITDPPATTFSNAILTSTGGSPPAPTS